MKIKLTEQNKKELEERHRVERDGRVRDRIKAVLLKSEGWTNVMIGQALRVHIDTVGQHLQDWQQEQKLKPENGGSQSKLNKQQTQQCVGYAVRTLQCSLAFQGVTIFQQFRMSGCQSGNRDAWC